MVMEWWWWFGLGFGLGWLCSLTLNYVAEGIAKRLLKRIKTPGVKE